MLTRRHAKGRKKKPVTILASFNKIDMDIKNLLCCKFPASKGGSIQHTGAPDSMATEVLIGNLELEWELPSRIFAQNIRDWMLGNPAATLKDGVVHMGCCDNEAMNLFGSVGSRVLEGVTSALESTDSTCRSMASYPNSLPSLY